MMHPGIVGALALIGTAGAIYFGSGYLSDYFAARNAETAVESAAQTDEPTGTPSSLIGDADTDASSTPAVEESTQAATEEVAAVADDVADAASDMAETVQETAQETLERVLEASPRNDSQTDEPESAPEPGTTPVLDIVRIEPTGEAVIAGNAPQGERVGLLYNNELIADSDVDAVGDFVLIPDEPIPSGEGTMEIVVIDDAGNTVTPSQEQVAVVLPEDGSTDGFLVGVLRPDEPVDIIERQAPEVEIAAVAEPTEVQETSGQASAETQQASDSVDETVEAPDVEIAARVEPTAPVETDGADIAEPFVLVDAIELEGTDMWIAGGALPGTVVRLYQDNVFLGEVIAGDEGRYLFEGTLLESEGEVTVRADALVTGSADVIARAEVPFEVPLSVSELAVAALEQVEESATEVAEAAQQLVSSAVETASETTQDLAESAIETVDEVADAVADVATDALEAIEDQATATVEQATPANDAVEETATELAAVSSEQAVEVEDAVVETPEEAVEETVETAQSDEASNGGAPDVEIAATTTPTVAETASEESVQAPADEATTPPTEALAEAQEEAAADAAEGADAGSQMADAATSNEATATPSPEAAVVETAASPSSESETAMADSTPASAPATQSERISVLDTGQVIIRRGDNLWRLSRRVYGQGIRYTSIYDANRDQITRPELIFPGQVFTLPTPQEEWGAVPGVEALEPDQIPGSEDAQN
jgi:nucleoid-associated protein YgaU